MVRLWTPVLLLLLAYSEGVTMESIRQLHDVMTAQELYRIQIAATDEVRYADFARVLGEVTGAGAQRVSVQLVAG